MPPRPVEEDRQPDDEPDVTEPNIKMRAVARRLTARFLANSSLKLFDAFALPSSRGRASSTPARTEASSATISHRAGRNPTNWSRAPPTKKPKPFMAFLEPVNQATQRNSSLPPAASLP